MPEQDELLSFLDEGEAAPFPPAGVKGQPWQVLIVDDDPDVHTATEFALDDTIIQSRHLELLHAHSSEEALQLLRQTPNVAVILLDVVMETEDAGLRIVRTIREELGFTHARIILRTGQPGHAPEIDTISRYDINDYKTKNELTRNKLYTVLTAAIRCYDQLCQLDASRRGLEQIVAASNQFILAQGLQAFAEGAIIQIAGFAGIEPEGVVCVSNHHGDASNHHGGDVDGLPIADPCPIITAATGRYRCLIQHHLREINDTRIVEHLTRCLAERRNLIDEHSLTLFFAGREGHDFAAFINSPAPLRDVDQHLLEVFCINIALCADNATLVSRLHNQAFVDGLVHLPNRIAFINAIDERLKGDERGEWVIALADVDQFAEINDMLGHHYGDLLLYAMARRLEQSPLGQCLVARIAGDKFGIFGEDLLVCPEILRSIFATPFDINGVEHPVSVSLGFVRLKAGSGRGAELLKDASIALKHAKSSGFGQTAYYSEAIRAETRERAYLLNELRRAFDHQHLFVVYQPQINLHSHAVIGVEALLRWRTEDGRLVPPDRFIPIAERSGLIIDLGHWALRTALHALTELQAAGYDRLRMAVNVSAVQFRQPQFLQTVETALRDTKTRAIDLELEITESVAALGFDYVEKLLHQLRAAGIGVAIDDFGTGFSSLSYLDHLPADRLKIDKCFISALDSQQPRRRIAEIVVELGRKLGMNVLAEGVETAAQAALLRELGCDDAQGYYFATPMLLEDLLGWLSTWNKGSP